MGSLTQAKQAIAEAANAILTSVITHIVGITKFVVGAIMLVGTKLADLLVTLTDEYGAWLPVILAVLVLILHFLKNKATNNPSAEKQDTTEKIFSFIRSHIGLYLGFQLALAGIVGFVIIFIDSSARVSLWKMSGILFVYGIGLYVTLCDVLTTLGLARRLTGLRKTWAKELEYPYLALGIFGILISASRLQFVQDAPPRIGVFGPIVVTTAIVIKFVKTRAEVEEWK